MNGLKTFLIGAYLFTAAPAGALAASSDGKAQAMSGIAFAQLAELMDQPQNIGSSANQAIADRDFAYLERMSDSEKLRTAFADLRPRLANVSSPAERAEDLKRLDILRHVFLSQLPAQAASRSLLGAVLQQIYYNATVLKDTAADAQMRAEIANEPCADEVSVNFGAARSQLAQLERGDLDHSAIIAKQLVDAISS